MDETKSVPKLRFSGFTDDWNEVTLNDVATFSKGKGISKNDISDDGVECVRYGELYTKYGEMIYNIESKTNLNKNELKLSEKNDILIPCSGETAIDLATASCIQKDQVAIGGDITIIKTNQYAPFITFYLNQKRTEIAKYAQGVSIVHLYPKDFKVLNMKIPSIDEQKKIIALLEEITKKEQLLESKYHEYQDFKKYLMQQIFAQKLRFKRDSSYSSYKLKDIVTKFSTGLNPRKNFKLNEGGENFYVTIKNFQNGILNLDEKCDKIDDNALKLINKRSDLQKDDLIFASIGRVGEVYLIKDKPLNWNINESVFSLRPNKQLIEPKFLYYLLNSNKVQNYFESNITGSTFKSIKMKDLKNTPVTIPDSFELQNEMIKFLTSVDSKILLIDDELNNMINFKKGLLQQMFDNMPLLFKFNIIINE